MSQKTAEGGPMATDWQTEDLLELIDPILADLQQRRKASGDEMTRHITMILNEFWRSHPKLTQVDELSLSLESMLTSLLCHRKGGSV